MAIIEVEEEEEDDTDARSSQSGHSNDDNDNAGIYFEPPRTKTRQQPPGASASAAARRRQPPLTHNDSLSSLLAADSTSQTQAQRSVIDLLQDPATAQQTWQDVLSCIQTLLGGALANDVDAGKVDRLAELILELQQLPETPLSRSDPLDDSANATLATICEVLVVPAHFVLPEYEITASIAHAQTFWRTGATALLRLLDALLQRHAVFEGVPPSAALPVELFVTLARFSVPSEAAEAQAGLPDDAQTDSRAVEEENACSWTTPLSSRTATQLLTRLLAALHEPERDEHKQEERLKQKPKPLGDPGHPLIARVLLEHIKPLFSQTPHKSLHPGTGRRLERQRGGDQFSDTWLEAPWKGKGGSDKLPTTSGSEALSGTVGCWRVLQAAVAALGGKGDMERSWPLVVPPLLTLLDDHETYYRRQGVRCLRLFLQRTPAVLLVRTGLGELIQKSLDTTYSFTSESDNIPMIRETFSAHLALIDLLHPVSRDERDAGTVAAAAPAFVPKAGAARRAHHQMAASPRALRLDALSGIYQSLILSIFSYQSTSLPFMELAFSLLPTLLHPRHLGLDRRGIRYLGDTVPVLCAALGDSPAAKKLCMLFSPQTLALHTAALRALRAVVRLCAGTDRMRRWRAACLASIARVWCNVYETDAGRVADTAALEDDLKRTVACLCEDDPTGEAAGECRRFIALDRALFEPLFAQAVSESNKPTKA